MTRVVAAVDGSPVSIEVLRGAVMLAELLGARTEALHVGGPPSRALLSLAAATGVRLTYRAGAVAQTVCRAFSETDVILGVIGTHGAGRTSVAQGHIAAAVMSAVEKPLLVVPPGSLPPHRRHMRRALVPLDSDPESAEAVERVLEILREGGVDLVVVHVRDRTTVLRQWDATRYVTCAWEKDLTDRDLPLPRTRLRPRLGPVGRRIVQTAIDQEAELVVIGWSQDLSPGHARLLQDLLASGGRPVLLLPRHDQNVIDLARTELTNGERV